MSDAGARLTVLAPMSGWRETLDDSPDSVFRDRVLGDGVSLDPTDSLVCAPFDAEVLSLPDSKHAINLRAANGAEFLLHIGIDTVNLGGDGFEAHVRVGDRVATGDPLLSFDMDKVVAAAVSLRTPILLLANPRFAVVPSGGPGPVAVGEPLFEVVAVEAESAAPPPQDAAPFEYSRRVRIGLSHGIHARPAAALIESLRDFEARVELKTDNERSADGRSAVSLMALGAGCGEAVTVSASGRDAEAALEAFVASLEPVEVAEKAVDVAAHESIAAPEAGSVLRATSASFGAAIGTSFALRAWTGPGDRAAGLPADELLLLDGARRTVTEHLESIAAADTGLASEIAAAHLALLSDPTIDADARAAIELGATAETAWHTATAKIAAALARLEDRRMRERADDLRDLDQRVQRVLAGKPPDEATGLPDTAVVVAHNLLPSQFLDLDHSRVAAICTAAGGATSHVAILAASLDIPMLVAAGDSVLVIEDGTRLFVDADNGELQIAPGEDAAAAIGARIDSDRAKRGQELSEAKDRCTTTDGEDILVSANLGSLADAVDAVKHGADGCGLLRTEFLFMERATPPSVDEQLNVYQAISNALGDRPMVVRTLDAGGDKPIAYVDQQAEENPALGVRGIRLSLENRALFETQLSALARVRRSTPLKIMIPMVTSVDEVEAVNTLVAGLIGSKRESNLRVGIMIETPAAALIAPALAEVVDFFSIGTNDLTQYALAMDRGEPALADRLDTLHPAVLRLIAQTVEAASAAGIPVSVCGGAAGDILAAPLLVGLGIRELSMVSSLVPRQKARLRTVDSLACTELAGRALELPSANRVRAMMRDALTGDSI